MMRARIDEVFYQHLHKLALAGPQIRISPSPKQICIAFQNMQM